MSLVEQIVVDVRWVRMLVLIIDSLQVFQLALSCMCNENNPFFLLQGFRWIITPKFSWHLFHLGGTCWHNEEYTQRMSAVWRAEWDFSSLSLLWCFLRLHRVSTVLCLSKYLRLASKSINTCTLRQGNICKWVDSYSRSKKYVQKNISKEFLNYYCPLDRPRQTLIPYSMQ